MDGVFINPKPSVVHQHMGSTAVVFHLNSHQREMQIFVQSLDLGQGQDHPKTGINEVSVFLMKEIMVQVGRRMWSFLRSASGNAGLLPGGGVIHVDLGTFVAEALQVGSGCVQNVLDHGNKVGRALHIMDKIFPGRSRGQMSRQVSYRHT